MDLGGAELVDKIEEYFGKRLTKIFLIIIVLGVSSAALSAVWTLALRPALVGLGFTPSVSITSQIPGYATLAFQILFWAAVASMIVDSFRKRDLVRIIQQRADLTLQQEAMYIEHIAQLREMIGDMKKNMRETDELLALTYMVANEWIDKSLEEGSITEVQAEELRTLRDNATGTKKGEELLLAFARAQILAPPS